VNPFPTTLSLLACRAGIGLLATALAPAQTVEAVPRGFTNVPGNAAVSLPFRWERGTMQVIYQGSVLPSGLAGKTITALSLRRPAFPDEPAYGQVNRTLRIWMASTSRGTVTVNTRGNFVGNPVEVLPPTVVNIGATQPTGVRDGVGADLLTVSLATPFVVGTAPHLFIQFEVSGPTFTVAPDNWIDAVWFPGGVDDGLVVPVGNGGCSSVSGTTSRLIWTANNPPVGGGTARVAASGFRPLAPCLLLLSPNPEVRPVMGPYLTPGFGRLLPVAGAPNCMSWGEPDFIEFAFTDANGGVAWSLPIPTGIGGGQKFGLQAACIPDITIPVPTTSNGLIMTMGPSGLAPAISTLLHPDVPVFPVPTPTPTNYVSAFPEYLGLAPVVQLHYQ